MSGVVATSRNGSALPDRSTAQVRKLLTNAKEFYSKHKFIPIMSMPLDDKYSMGKLICYFMYGHVKKRRRVNKQDKE
jgi:hypothetical protein